MSYAVDKCRLTKEIALIGTFRLSFYNRTGPARSFSRTAFPASPGQASRSASVRTMQQGGESGCQWAASRH